ncbi:integrase catalytic subunit (plasmid) [Kalymmatonema gypsitolerans NIES-4073]|nr:integrase catalytic subunit [Scytonema sp. NIES-4073]
MINPSGLTSLPEAERERALQRFKILRPFLEEGVPLTEVATTHHISVSTLKQWALKYRKHGLAGLTRSPRTDRGKRRCITKEITELIEGLALQKPKKTIAAIYRQVVHVHQEIGQKPPSYDTVYAIIRNISPAMLTLAHEGSKAYKDMYDLLYRREAKAPNTIWQADHTLLDIWLINEQGKAARPWLTVIIDDYSRAIAGYHLFFSAPSARQTALALRQAIWRKANPGWQICGIPEILYTDHGSDFTSAHIEQVCADLKIQLVFSQVGQPRGRGKVERFFRTVNQMLLMHLEGYTPEGTNPPALPKLTLSDLSKEFERFLHHYHQRSHDETEQPPQERWLFKGFLPQMPSSLEALDLLLLTVIKSRRIRRDGIYFQGLSYIDPLLANYVGEEVTIRYDPNDMAEIRVFYHDTFLCRAICQQLATESVTLKDILAARKQRRRDLSKIIDKRLSLVDAILKPPQDNQDTELLSPITAPKSKLKRYASDD